MLHGAMAIKVFRSFLQLQVHAQARTQLFLRGGAL